MRERFAVTLRVRSPRYVRCLRCSRLAPLYVHREGLRRRRHIRRWGHPRERSSAAIWARWGDSSSCGCECENGAFWGDVFRHAASKRPMTKRPVSEILACTRDVTSQKLIRRFITVPWGTCVYNRSLVARVRELQTSPRANCKGYQ